MVLTRNAYGRRETDRKSILTRSLHTRKRGRPRKTCDSTVAECLKKQGVSLKKEQKLKRKTKNDGHNLYIINIKCKISNIFPHLGYLRFSNNKNKKSIRLK